MAFSMVTIPQNYQAELDSQLLAQPESQYFYAQLVKAALGISSGMELPDVRSRPVSESFPLCSQSIPKCVGFVHFILYNPPFSSGF